MNHDVVIVRGGGDIATGVIQKLFRTGFKTLVLEIEKPTAIRRTVAVSETVYEQRQTIEDLTSVLVQSRTEIETAWNRNEIPVVIDPKGEYINKLKPLVVVDAILAKRNMGTVRDLAPITIGLGPGFSAGRDVDAVIETMRGHTLGRLILSGESLPNTGIPGDIAGASKERVIYSPCEGPLRSLKAIGEPVKQDEVIAHIGETPVKSPISGILRGIIRDGFSVSEGLKIADVDPREAELQNCFTISDKARTIGGAVLEAILYFKEKRENIWKS